MKTRKRQFIEEYEINRSTMAIIPVTYGSKVYSKVYELNEEYLSPFKPLDIIRKSCEYFGATYEGRKQGTRKLIGVTHKVPIAIAPTNTIYFFPTVSPDKSQCIWISSENISRYERLESNSILVTFTNKQGLKLPISYNSFQNQLYRTNMLKSKLLQRIEDADKRGRYLQTAKHIEASEGNAQFEISL